MFFHYYQGNPGGFMLEDMPYHVVIEADSFEEANLLAVEHGIYFDGVKNGIDCRCCGDRWERQTSDYMGDKVPMVFGLEVEPGDSIRVSRYSREETVLVINK